jgi:hypothetical protein
VTFFHFSKSTTQLTTKNHQLTTFSPQKTINKTHKYAQPPVKLQNRQAPQNSRANPSFTTGS